MMLLPVRTAGTHFHDLLAPNADLFFLRHKVQFHGSKGVPTFNSMVAIFGGDDGVTERMLEAHPCSHFRFADRRAFQAAHSGGVNRSDLVGGGRRPREHEPQHWIGEPWLRWGRVVGC